MTRPRTPAVQAPVLSRRSVIRRTGVLALAGFGLACLVGFLIFSGYRGAMRAADTTTRNVALIIEERLDATLRRADAHLQEMVRNIPAEALGVAAIPHYADAIDAALEDHLLNFPEVARFSVADSDGNLLYLTDRPNAPLTNFADRDHFKAARDGPPGGVFFSEVITGRLNGKSTVVMTRAIRDASGAFEGTVFALINLDYFEDLFRSLDVGRHGTVTIYRTDDFKLVARWPPTPAGLNRPLPRGGQAVRLVEAGISRASFRTVSFADGIERLFSMQVLKRYPFFVGVGLATEDVLAAWKLRSLFVGGTAALLLAALGALVYRLWRREDELGLAKQAADAASASKSAFLANMSHELRTPLNAILGFSQIIAGRMHGPLTDRYAAYGHDILKAGSHLLELINSVLDLSKIEAGKFELREERLHVAELVEASVALVRLQAEAKQVALTHCVPLELPPLQADETALRQILVNLLSNAVKFTPSGGTVTAEAALAADGGLCLAVADTGIGMTAEEIVKATEPFAQIDGPLTRRQAGTGLGLPISKRLTELMGGRFEIDSRKAAGTTVRIVLPASRVLAAGAPPLPAAAPPAAVAQNTVA